MGEEGKGWCRLPSSLAEGAGRITPSQQLRAEWNRSRAGGLPADTARPRPHGEHPAGGAACEGAASLSFWIASAQTSHVHAPPADYGSLGKPAPRASRSNLKLFAGVVALAALALVAISMLSTQVEPRPRIPSGRTTGWAARRRRRRHSGRTPCGMRHRGFARRAARSAYDGRLHMAAWRPGSENDVPSVGSQSLLCGRPSFHAAGPLHLATARAAIDPGACPPPLCPLSPLSRPRIESPTSPVPVVGAVCEMVRA